MERPRRFDDELTELGKIDFLLDELARAVERGEVHRDSYDLMSPRYLERRTVLVDRITGDAGTLPGYRLGAGATAADSTSGTADDRSAAAFADTYQHGSLVPAAATASAGGNAYLPTAGPTASPERHTVPGYPAAGTRVAWTTVLLFLGAFLVIVASAIFAVAIWDGLGVAGKFGLLAMLTAGFYAAGGWARRRLEAPAGGTALVAVASALLLFDGWVLIDGLGLSGPLPWALLLLVCWVVYWFTEVLLAGGFFGVIGAAAQLGWWWLLGEGIGLPVPMRLAGMGLVALGWQLAAERGHRAPTVRSLADVLGWAAPAVHVLLAIAFTANLLLVQSAGLTEIAAAAVVALTAGITFVRSRAVQEAGPFAAALLQWPLAATIAVAVMSAGHSWSIVGVLLVLVVAYAAVALTVEGTAFGLLALGAELALVLEVGTVLDWAPATITVAVAVVGAGWAVASRLARALSHRDGAPAGAAALAAVAELAALAVLAVSSVVLFATRASAGDAVVAGDVLRSAAVFVAWVVAVLATRNPAFLFGAAVWSLVPVWEAGGLAFGDRLPAVRFGLLLVTAAGWLGASSSVGGLVDQPVRTPLRWSARAVMLLAVVAGCAAELSIVTTGAWGTLGAALLALLAAALFLLDGIALRTPASLSAASGLAVVSGALAGGSFPTRYAEQFAIAGSTTGALLAVSGAALSRFAERYGSYMALPAAFVTAIVSLAAMGEPPALVLAFSIATVTWVAAAIASERWLAFIAAMTGLAAVVSAMWWAAGPPLVTSVVVGGASMALASVALLTRRPVDRPEPVVPLALAAAGLIGLLGLVATGFFAEVLVVSASWWAVSGHALALSLAMLGATGVLLAWRFDVEFAYYAGWAAILLALWVEFGLADVAYVEFYSTSLALYLVAMGYLATRLVPERPYPAAVDVAAVFIGLGVPIQASVGGFPPDTALVHSLIAIALSLVSIAAGVVAKVRVYLFGGAGALAGIAFYRSATVLAENLWAILFLVGMMLLAIALTWERQRSVVSSTREALARSFEQWR